MIDHNGLLVATIDTNRHGPSVEDMYTGQHFRAFKLNLWRTAKAIVESAPGNMLAIAGEDTSDFADAFKYVPHYDEAHGGIVHSFITTKQIMAKFYGDSPLFIPPGTRIDTGYSQKRTVKEVAEAAEEAGWQLVAELGDGMSTIRAVVLAAKNTSSDLIARAKIA
jgi:hypothetical protein